MLIETDDFMDVKNSSCAELDNIEQMLDRFHSDISDELDLSGWLSFMVDVDFSREENTW